LHTPRKRFGQNFLEDRDVIVHIVAAIHPLPGDTLIEIGPGLGALTAPLLERVDRINVVEIDRDIVATLRGRFPEERLVIHQGDALEFDFAALGTEIRVVGNLPYNISTPILFHLSAQANAIRDAHFMLQREVVARMAAQPDSPEYGRLSVMLQYRWEIEPLFDVPPSAFRPQPKVWSSVVRMRPYRSLPHPCRDAGLFAEVVTRAFGQRRKTLRNALRALVDEAEIAALGIDPGVRGEALGVADFVLLADYLSDRKR
jgi:16S rRNA (adenine1518-N6/adenine1519-N6)-dimethyltransferase